MFDATQYATLRAVIDRMIPRDDAPGGLDAGVDRYILHLLQHDGVGYSALYMSLLDALQHEAHVRHNLAFAQLSAHDADAILHAFARSESSAVLLANAAWCIATVAEHCAEGFYADPRQGGNHDTVSWQMIGFEERR